jgi:hypothetical protein
MPNNITNKIRVFNAAQFIESIGENNPTRLYLFVGRHQPWNENDIPNNVTLLEGEEYDAQYNMIGVKRIFPLDMSHVVRRIDWRPDTVFDFYDDRDEDLYSKNFYVINRNYDVYICLFNNNRSFSTVQPLSRSTRAFETSDGYKWKYLYNIPVSAQLRFLTAQWMPVLSDNLIVRTAEAGEITTILPVNLGDNYTKSNTSIAVVGDGEGLDVDFTVVDGRVTRYAVLDGGANYKYANIVLNTVDQGDGATARIIIPPTGGHGSNPINELNARYVMVNSRLEYAEGYSDFPIDISYRTIGLVRALVDDSALAVNQTTANANKTLQITTADGDTNFLAAQFITGANSGANGYILTSNVISNTRVEVRYSQGFDLTENFKSFNVGEAVFASNTNATGTIAAIAGREANPLSGEILYIDNRPPVDRAPDQAENIHIVLEF